MRQGKDLNRLKVPYAIGPDEKHFRPIDVDPNTYRRGMYTCPGCAGALGWRRRSTDGRLPHFHHERLEDCEGGQPETLAHQDLKIATIDLIRELGVNSVLSSPLDFDWKRDAEPEVKYPGTNWQSDVAVWAVTGKPFLGFEVVVTSDLNQDKRREITSMSDVFMVRLDADEFAKEMRKNIEADDTENWDRQLRARTFVQGKGYQLVKAIVQRQVRVVESVDYRGGDRINCDRVPDDHFDTSSSNWTPLDEDDDFLGFRDPPVVVPPPPAPIVRPMPPVQVQPPPPPPPPRKLFYQAEIDQLKKRERFVSGLPYGPQRSMYETWLRNAFDYWTLREYD